MAPLRVVPFTDEHLEDAAALLADRARRQRAAEPLLVPDDPRAALEALLREERTSGHAAVRGGTLEAYVLAGLDDDEWFGRHAWTGPPGHATRDPEALRDTYAVAADGWFRTGHRRHYVDVPALPADLDPWYRLGFHHMHVDAGIRETAALPVETEGFIIREGRSDELDELVRIDLLIFRHQQTTPSFGLVDIELDLVERRAEWSEYLAREGFIRYVVAERDGRIIGHSGLEMFEPMFALPPDTTDVSSTAVEPSERGRGVGTALTNHVIGLAAELGYPVIGTAWRMSNLLASRFWPAHGFRPAYHRLHRLTGVG